MIKMSKIQAATRKQFRKEGILFESDQKLEIRREYRVETPISWNETEMLLKKSVEEVKQAFDYLATFATKQPNGIFPVEVDLNNKSFNVYYEYVDENEVHIQKVEEAI